MLKCFGSAWNVNNSFKWKWHLVQTFICNNFGPLTFQLAPSSSQYIYQYSVPEILMTLPFVLALLCFTLISKCFARWEKVGFKLLSQALFYHSLHNHFCHFCVHNWEQHHECLWWETDCHVSSSPRFYNALHRDYKDMVLREKWGFCDSAVYINTFAFDRTTPHTYQLI